MGTEGFQCYIKPDFTRWAIRTTKTCEKILFIFFYMVSDLIDVSQFGYYEAFGINTAKVSVKAAVEKNI